MCEGDIKTNPRPKNFYRAETAPPGFEIPGSATVDIIMTTDENGSDNLRIPYRTNKQKRKKKENTKKPKKGSKQIHE